MADQRRKSDNRNSPGVSRPASTGNRKQVEDASRPLLVRLSAMPRLVVPLGTLVLVALGLFAPLSIALPALALVFFFFAWIAFLSWPVVLDRRQGAARRDARSGAGHGDQPLLTTASQDDRRL